MKTHLIIANVIRKDNAPGDVSADDRVARRQKFPRRTADRNAPPESDFTRYVTLLHGYGSLSVTRDVCRSAFPLYGFPYESYLWIVTFASAPGIVAASRTAKQHSTRSPGRVLVAIARVTLRIGTGHSQPAH